jgi:hypothetical protein
LGQVFRGAAVIGERWSRSQAWRVRDRAAIRENAMILLRRIAIAAAACAVASLSALADDQKPAPGQPAYTPRLNDIMILTQLGHFKLWYAGAVQNWPLANYELEQIRASVRLAKTLFPDSEVS